MALTEDQNCCAICGGPLRSFGRIPAYFCPEHYHAYETDILAPTAERPAWLHYLANAEKQRRKRRQRRRAAGIILVALPVTLSTGQHYGTV